MKTILKALLRHTPYRVTRAMALNRFDATEEIMSQLRKRGFHPTRIIDAGANVGSFAVKAKRTFPQSIIELIEPQPACFQALRRLEQNDGFVLHPFALVGKAEAGQPVRLAAGPNVASTGAHITFEANIDAIEVPAATLDQLLADGLQENDRLLLKLDLQGYELEALAGGERTLKKTEVLLSEVSFFAQAYEPPIAKLVQFLEARGFDLYEIAALSERPRDGRARQGDFVFVHHGSALRADGLWS